MKMCAAGVNITAVQVIAVDSDVVLITDQTAVSLSHP